MSRRNDSEMYWTLRFGHNLQRTLRIYGVSQGRLAQELGLTEAMISRYIHGLSVPSVYKVCQMASVIGCNISDLIKTEYEV